jgi:exosortase A
MFLTPPPDVLMAPAARTSGRSLALIALALLAPFALYFGTARSMVAIWNSSETFAHGYAILPISLWLIWRERARFDTMAAVPYWPALGAVALAGAGWLLARLGEVQVVQQYAFVAMFPLIALGLLGPRLARAFAFPLLYLLFAVPFGEILVEPLIEFTADFTVWAVQMTGIPVLRTGTRFELPTGNWSVVEACSGVRYLISSITIGCLYAYLTYRSLQRRLLFIAFSIIVPIVANGLRAYMIVMIGHFSGMELATGVDHIIYGWLFFGLVMLLMFWIGSYWREDDPDAPLAAAATAAATPRAAAGGMVRIALALIALCALWPALALYLDRVTYNPKPVVLGEIAVGWARTSAFSPWQPAYMAPDAARRAVYRAGNGAPVALTVLYYRNQSKDKALISSVNRLTAEEDVFHQNGASVRTEQVGERRLALRETTVQGPSGRQLVWHWLWIDNRATVNNYLGKLWQAEAKLLMRGDDGAAILLAAPYGDNPEQARAALRPFLAQHLGAIETALVAARQN